MIPFSQTAKNLADSVIVASTAGILMKWLPIAVGIATLLLTIIRIVVEWPAFCARIKQWLRRVV